MKPWRLQLAGPWNILVWDHRLPRSTKCGYEYVALVERVSVPLNIVRFLPPLIESKENRPWLCNAFKNMLIPYFFNVNVQA